MTNGGVPMASVLVSCPERLKLARPTPPLKFGVPENVGEPEKVPANDPPRVRFAGPLAVRPTVNVAAPLKVELLFQTLAPVQVFARASREVNEDEMLSSLQS
jgi:hypothetical protein